MYCTEFSVLFMDVGFAKMKSQSGLSHRLEQYWKFKILACTVILSSCMGSGIGQAGNTVCHCQFTAFLNAVANPPPPAAAHVLFLLEHRRL
jgi:hypothetical protein